MRYLTEGITWSPFYRLDLSEEKGKDGGGKLTVSAAKKAAPEETPAEAAAETAD